jgi:transcriptional regulator GlxA family with amidase domain
MQPGEEESMQASSSLLSQTRNEAARLVLDFHPCSAPHTAASKNRTRASLSHDRRLNMARQWLQAHYFEPIQLSDIARIANMSVFHFCRSYRNQFGLPPHHEVLCLRLQLAEYLLKNSNEPVTDIANAVGFESRTTLFRHLMRSRGRSPMEIRQEARRGMS